MPTPIQRAILHVDMDAFYASVEQRDDPALRGRPLAVGSASARGVVAAASYEARAFGVHSALASRIAVSRCPHLVFVKPRFEVYKAVSTQIRAVFERYTDVIEPLSLDEAYLDISASAKTLERATDIARAIKREIKAATQLNASAGVAQGKFLAKLASDMDKPDGLYVVHPDEVVPLLRALPVGKFHGIGPATAAKLEALGIRTGADMADADRLALLRRFGKRGGYFQDIARGIDERPVRANRIRKSVSKETTFASDKIDHDELAAELPALAEKVWANLERLGRRGRNVVVKVKYRDHAIRTRQEQLGRLVADAQELARVGERILRTRVELPLPVRLLGIGVSDLEDVDAPQVQPGQTLRLDL